MSKYAMQSVTVNYCLECQTPSQCESMTWLKFEYYIYVYLLQSVNYKFDHRFFFVIQMDYYVISRVTSGDQIGLVREFVYSSLIQRI